MSSLDDASYAKISKLIDDLKEEAMKVQRASHTDLPSMLELEQEWQIASSLVDNFIGATFEDLEEQA